MEAVLFIGIQGAGKSTFYRERFFDTHVRINLDMLRTRKRERVLLEACLSARQPFVVDNTNVSAAERAVYIEAAKAVGFKVVGYYFVPDAAGSLRRNNRRAGKKAVPVPAVLGTLSRLEPPRLEEGFDELHEVEIGGSGAFVIRP